MAIKIALWSVHLPGQLVVKEAATVLEPLWVGGLGVGDALSKIGTIGNDEHSQSRILASIFRQTVNNMLPCWRRTPPVQGDVARMITQRSRIDKEPVATVLPHEQLIVVGASRSLLKEHQTSLPLDTAS